MQSAQTKGLCVVRRWWRHRGVQCAVLVATTAAASMAAKPDEGVPVPNEKAALWAEEGHKHALAGAELREAKLALGQSFKKFDKVRPALTPHSPCWPSGMVPASRAPPRG